jgi:hypothetical protein
VRFSPPLPLFSPQLRRAANPYKVRRAARLAATAWIDTRVENQLHPPTDCGVDASNVDVVGSTPTGCATFAFASETRPDPAKVGFVV